MANGVYYGEKRSKNHSSNNPFAHIVEQATAKQNRKTVLIVAGVIGTFFLWSTFGGFSQPKVKPRPNSSEKCTLLIHMTLTVSTSFIPHPSRLLRQSNPHPSHCLPAAGGRRLSPTRQCGHVLKLQIPSNMQYQQSGPTFTFLTTMSNT